MLGAFPELLFYKVFSYKLKLCKDCARELNKVSRNWSVRLKAASDLFSLMQKELKNPLTVSGRDSGEIFEGSIISLNLPIV